MSDFGDFDPDDAFDTSPPDPLQVAILLHRFKREEDPSLPQWDDLNPVERALTIKAIAKLIALLVRQGGIR